MLDRANCPCNTRAGISDGVSVMTKYQGVVDHYCETGYEGLPLVFFKDGARKAKGPYDSMVPIDDGDHLKVFAKDGSVIVDILIAPDSKVRWAKLFIRNYLLKAGSKPLRAELTKR